MHEQTELQASAPAKRGRGRPPANGKAKPLVDGDDDEDLSDEDSGDGGKKSKNAFGAKPPQKEDKVENRQHVVAEKELALKVISNSRMLHRTSIPAPRRRARTSTVAATTSPTNW